MFGLAVGYCLSYKLMLCVLILERAFAIIGCVMLVIQHVFLFDVLIRHHSTENRCGNAVLDKTA